MNNIVTNLPAFATNYSAHYNRILDALHRHHIHTTRDVDLRSKSWLYIGGTADMLVQPHDRESLRTTLQLLKDAAIPTVIIGDGSNLLFADEGVRGAVIQIGRHMADFSINDTNVSVQAGAWVPHVARRIGCSGLTGLEHIIGIPGTIGGLAVMNGGSMRKGIGTHITKVEGLDAEGEPLSMTHEECAFSYRASALQGAGAIVTDVYLTLERGNAANIRHEMIRIMASRRAKFPKQYPNCGSVFLSNPAMYEHIGPPGKAIEDRGLRGVRAGGAQISPLHGNFIINVDNAKAVDVLQLIHQMRSGVHEATGYVMDCEVRFITPDAEIVPAHEISDRIYGFNP